MTFYRAVNSNICSRTHRLATILHVTDDGDERRNTAVPIARPLVRSAKTAELIGTRPIVYILYLTLDHCAAYYYAALWDNYTDKYHENEAFPLVNTEMYSKI